MKYRIIIKLIYPSGAERILKTIHLFEDEAKAIEVKEKLTAMVEESFTGGLDGHITAPTIDGYAESINLQKLAGFAVTITKDC